jgi:hypothetical protein
MSISKFRPKLPKNDNILNISDHQDPVKKTEIINNFKSTPTIISPDLKIQGEIFSAGIIEIQGLISGTINGNIVILREDGVFHGTVFAENFSIRGKFEGIIKSKSVSILSKAKVRGEIHYDNLSVEDGANIDGNFKKL